MKIADYEEAMRNGGDEWDKWLIIKERMDYLAEKANLSEKEKDEQSRIFTSLYHSLWEKMRDKGVSFDEFMNYVVQDVVTNERFNTEPVEVQLDENGRVTEEQLEQQINEDYGFQNLTEEDAERVAIMEENGATTQEITQAIQTMRDFGKEGGKLFSRSAEDIQKDEERKRQFASDVNSVIKEAEKTKPGKKSAGFGIAKDWLVNISDRFGLNVSGFKHVVDANGVRHIKNRHGEGNEVIENQIPVTDDDIRNIPDVVNIPDYLVYGTKSNNGRDGIGYLKTMPDNTTYYVEEVKDNDKQLAAKTLYKIEGETAENLVKNSRRSTSETTPSAATLENTLKRATVVPAFANNISSGNIDVKRVDEKTGKLYSRTYGAYIPTSRIIELAQQPNVDTFMHEMSHNYFMTYLDFLERNVMKDEAKVLYAKSNPMEFRRHKAPIAQVFAPSDGGFNIDVT